MTRVQIGPTLTMARLILTPHTIDDFADSAVLAEIRSVAGGPEDRVLSVSNGQRLDETFDGRRE